MNTTSIRVTYRLETAGSIEALAAKIASDQSTGTFTEVPGETAAVQARCAARVESITPLPPAQTPALAEPGQEKGPTIAPMSSLPSRWKPSAQILPR